MARRCPGDHEHAECRGMAAQASSYYPPLMCKEVVKAMTKQWSSEDVWMASQVEDYLIEADPEMKSTECDLQENQIYALSRTKMNLEEAPTGKRLEAIKQMMMRVHRASGHASFHNLVKLLQARGSPAWAIELAKTLVCPECVEASKPRPAPPASTGDEPQIFETLGADAFEYEDEAAKVKYKMMIWRDRASGLVMFDTMKSFPMGENWEPTTADVIRSFGKWAMAHPTPQWVIADSARYFTSLEMVEFCGRSGMGLSIVPAEAHWLLGNEEQAIGVAKRVIDKMRREYGQYDVETLFSLVAHSMNSHIGSNGFSPYQWVYGRDFFAKGEDLPIGLDPSKAFGGLLKARERVRNEVEKERARDRFSKLANSVTRPPMKCHTGQLVMLWRQRVKPGKVKGLWTGPLRVVVVEGSTVWLATGSSLVRAKMNQIRAVTRREELDATMEGTAIYKMPVTVDSLMKAFKGRYYMDVSGDVPSEARLQSDLSPTEALVPGDSARTDSWLVREDQGRRTLVRIHRLPRLALFSPLKMTNSPISMDELTGKRTTVVKPLHGGSEVTIEDTMDVVRSLQDRWIGETQFELVEPARPPKMRRSVPAPPKKQGTKRKADAGEEGLQPPSGIEREEEAPGPDDQAEQQGAAIPSRELEEALHDRGLDRVDGLPRPLPGSAGSNGCAVPGCDLPGGHSGPHEGVQGRFLYDPYDGRTWQVDEDETIPVEEGAEDTMSTSSEELLPELPGRDDHGPQGEQEEDVFYALELNLEAEDVEWLSRNSRSHRPSVWLSKKMSEKGKEVVWNKLPLEQKKLFDLAQAKELSQVAVSGALRSLTKEEELQVDPAQLMRMRWVMTFKGDGTPKARLVILGFMAHNLTEVETASPTMSKAGRHVILMTVANCQLSLMSGDVTSAFLQADADLEQEKLTVWGPPELSVMFGGSPNEPKALRVRKAFYGLVHAPRAWFQSVVNALLAEGWTQLVSDKCVFVLMEQAPLRDDLPSVRQDASPGAELPQQQAEGLPDSLPPGRIVGVAGIHVDDFLLGGDVSSSLFQKAEKALKETFRFGKWEEGSDGFEFAGCFIKQLSDRSITLNQESYTLKWMEEIEIDKTRAKSAPLTPREISQLRAALGTVSWRATQSAPQFLADTSLLLSEINKGTVNTLYKTNKLVREMKRTAGQSLLFPSWGIAMEDIAVITWADASNHNRPDRSSTVGIITGAAPRQFLSGEECQVAILQWKSGKTPRQCLGSNGAEVQSITIGEDMNFSIRGLIYEISGRRLLRERLHEQISTVPGCLVMDSRGIYDAMTRNMSPLHGLRDSRAGYELTVSVNQATRALTKLRWVNGLAQLADSLTKSS